MNELNLVPMRHRDSDAHYRVPVYIRDGAHTVFVGDNLRRHFDQDTLPDVLKHKLSMINGSPYGEVLDRGQVTNMDVYIAPNNIGDFEMIGWRVTDDLYCVVLTEKELDHLRGEKI